VHGTNTIMISALVGFIIRI